MSSYSNETHAKKRAEMDNFNDLLDSFENDGAERAHPAEIDDAKAPTARLKRTFPNDDDTRAPMAQTKRTKTYQLDAEELKRNLSNYNDTRVSMAPRKRTKTYQIDAEEQNTQNELAGLKEMRRNTRDELAILKEKRRIRDEEEQYQGLKNFKGNQRGWNGLREPLRQANIAANPDLIGVKVAKVQEHAKVQEKPTKAQQKSKGQPLPMSQGFSDNDIGRVTAEQLRDDIRNFRSREEINLMALEDQAATLQREAHEYSMRTVWDYDSIARGSLRNGASPKAKRVSNQQACILLCFTSL